MINTNCFKNPSDFLSRPELNLLTVAIKVSVYRGNTFLRRQLVPAFIGMAEKVYQLVAMATHTYKKLNFIGGCCKRLQIDFVFAASKVALLREN